MQSKLLGKENYWPEDKIENLDYVYWLPKLSNLVLAGLSELRISDYTGNKIVYEPTVFWIVKVADVTHLKVNLYLDVPVYLLKQRNLSCNYEISFYDDY